jgi:hypothetical protein
MNDHSRAENRTKSVLLGESSRNTIEPRAIADARSRGINDQATKSALDNSSQHMYRQALHSSSGSRPDYGRSSVMNRVSRALPQQTANYLEDRRICLELSDRHFLMMLGGFW